MSATYQEQSVAAERAGQMPNKGLKVLIQDGELELDIPDHYMLVYSVPSTGQLGVAHSFNLTTSDNCNSSLAMIAVALSLMAAVTGKLADMGDFNLKEMLALRSLESVAEILLSRYNIERRDGYGSHNGPD